MMITNVRGGFSGVQGTIEYDPDNPDESHIQVVIDATQHQFAGRAEGHASEEPEFLHVEQHPTITFKSKKMAEWARKNGRSPAT